MADVKTLSPAVAAKYELVGLQPGKVILPARFDRKEVDFSTMTLAEADALVEKFKDVPGGFSYLKLKTASSAGSSTKP